MPVVQSQTSRCQHVAEIPHYVRSGNTLTWRTRGQISGCEYHFAEAKRGVMDVCVRNVPGGGKSMHVIVAGGSNGGGFAINILRLLSPHEVVPVNIIPFDFAFLATDLSKIYSRVSFDSDNEDTLKEIFQEAKNNIEEKAGDEPYFRITYMAGKRLNDLTLQLKTMFETPVLESPVPVQIRVITHHHADYWYTRDGFSRDDIQAHIVELSDVLRQRDQLKFPDFDVYFLTSARENDMATRQLQTLHSITRENPVDSLYTVAGWGSFASSTNNGDQESHWDPVASSWKLVDSTLENLKVLRGDEGNKGDGHDTNLFQILKAQRLFNVFCHGWPDSGRNTMITFDDASTNCTYSDGVWHLKYKQTCRFEVVPDDDSRFSWNGMRPAINNRPFNHDAYDDVLEFDPFNTTVPADWDVQIPGLNETTFQNLTGFNLTTSNGVSRSSLPDTYVDFHFVVSTLSLFVVFFYMVTHPKLKGSMDKIWDSLRRRQSSQNSFLNPNSRDERGKGSNGQVKGLAFARYLASVHIVVGHLANKSNSALYIVPFGVNKYGFSWVPWFLMVSSFILSYGQLAKWQKVLESNHSMGVCYGGLRFSSAHTKDVSLPSKTRKHPSQQQGQQGEQVRSNNRSPYHNSASSSNSGEPFHHKRGDRGPRAYNQGYDTQQQGGQVRGNNRSPYHNSASSSNSGGPRSYNQGYDTQQQGGQERGNNRSPYHNSASSSNSGEPFHHKRGDRGPRPYNHGHDASKYEDSQNGFPIRNNGESRAALSVSMVSSSHCSGSDWFKPLAEEHLVIKLEMGDALPWYKFVYRRIRSIYPLYLVGLICAAIVDSMVRERAFSFSSGERDEALSTISSLALLQAWIPQVTENVYQSHCWFLSCILVYWALHGALLRFWYQRATKLIVATLVFIMVLPWIGLVLVPLGMEGVPLNWYSEHIFGRFSKPVDIAVVLLKFHPVSFFHIYVAGMLVAILGHRYKLSPVTPTSGQWIDYPFIQRVHEKAIQALTFCITYGATIGYFGLFSLFALDSVFGLYPAYKLSMRLGTLLPFQSLILLGLTYDEDPTSRLFSLPLCQVIGDLSYPQYVFQFVALNLWYAHTGFGYWALLTAFAVAGEFVQSSFKSPRAPKKRKLLGGLVCVFIIAFCVTGTALYAVDARQVTLSGVGGGSYSQADYDIEISLCFNGTQDLTPLVDGNNGLTEHLINPSIYPISGNTSNIRVAFRRHIYDSENGDWYSGIVLAFLDEFPVNLLELRSNFTGTESMTGGDSRRLLHEPLNMLHRLSEDRTLEEEAEYKLEGCNAQAVNVPEEDFGDFCSEGKIGGLEDPRIVNSYRDEQSVTTLMTVFVPCTSGDDLFGRVFRLKHKYDLATGDSEVVSLTRLDPSDGTAQDIEKNWMALPSASGVEGDRYIRNMEPLLIVEAEAFQEEDRSSTVFARDMFVTPHLTRMRFAPGSEFDGDGDEYVLLHGGANAVTFHPGTLIATFHSVVGGQYFNFAVELEDTEPFRILRVSRPLPLIRLPLEDDSTLLPMAFCSGILVLRGEDQEVTKVVFTYGSSNRQARALSLGIQSLEFFFQRL